MSKATASKCQKTFHGMMTALGRAKENFEQSGKGSKRGAEGNVVPSKREANYGREVQHLIVYLWFVLDSRKA